MGDASEQVFLQDLDTGSREPEARDQWRKQGTTSSHELQQKLLKEQKRANQIIVRPGPLRAKIKNSFPAGLDLNAMSVASLYNGDETREMDTQRDFYKVDEKLQSKVLANLCENYDQNHGTIEINEIATVSSSTTAEAELSKSQCNNNCYNSPPSQFPGQIVNKSLFFSDGIRSVDFVLAWQVDIINAKNNEESKNRKRIVFEENLEKEGLELEREIVEQELNFVKVHAPLEVLRRYSEILKLRMPMKESLSLVGKNPKRSTFKSSTAALIGQKIPGFNDVKTRTTSVLERVKSLLGRLANKIFVDEKNFPARSHRFTAVYSRDKEYLFDLNQACFFTAAVRSRIVQFILDRKRFSIETFDDYAFGIDRLITDQVYLAAYPLHDGELMIKGSMRNLLFTEWAAVRKWYRYQPLDYIKEYFGVKIGLYFAWLGFYTYMLMLASIVGAVCFVYSWLTLDSYRPSQDICSGNMNIKMCPLCDHWCDYWDLKETCLHARVTYLFDNPTTVFFAIFMSFWATLFLELWKRYSAEITHRWDLTGFDVHEEHPRPQYLARLAHVQRQMVNVVTNTIEPQVPFWRMKLPATILSFSIVLLLVAVAVAAVIAVVLYRMSVLAALSVTPVTTSSALLFTTATAASINLCLIVLFNWMYTWLAEYLTEVELLRTQTEFDDSLTLKIYLLQFVNYYASIFYIAFFKGKFVGHPGAYNRFFNYRQEECGFGGCLTELCIQLAIIMIGKQAMNTILEMILPIFYKWFYSLRVRLIKLRVSVNLKSKGERWLRDLKLVEWNSRSLFPEYLEMVLQYGFVTIFVSAFPLAPLFALINNFFEMRLDAKKLLTFYRRPVSQRVRDIGVWYRILDSIGKLSVITNGFIIAFTSDFIPRIVYRTTISPNGSLEGYLNYSLAYFNTTHLEKGSEPHTTEVNVSICRYPDFREPHWSSRAYEKTSLYWHILAARLAFVVVFENVVALVMILVRWCIPDMSPELRDQIRREAYITNEIIIKQETLRAAQERNESISREEPNASARLITMEQIMSTQLSETQLDLAIHGPGTIDMADHPEKYRKVHQAFIDAEVNSAKNGPVSL